MVFFMVLRFSLKFFLSGDKNQVAIDDLIV